MTNAGDQTYRALPPSAAANEILQSHSRIGFDRTLTQRDIYIVYPVARLRELVVRGELGAVGPTNFSFMEALRDWTTIINETGPR